MCTIKYGQILNGLNEYKYQLICGVVMSGEQVKRQFVVPKKEELIEQIKNMQDDIDNVSLNLIKCNFDATEKDVEKTFPEFTFIKVKKYNPGSFEIIFETKIDAINFIRNSNQKRILNRKFFIKMGRQQKEHAENWAAVGYIPKQFKGPRKNHNQNTPKKQTEAQGQEEATREEGKTQTVTEPTKTEVKVETKRAQEKPAKVQQKVQQKTQPKVEPKVEQKVQKKVENKPQKIQSKPQAKVQQKVEVKVETKIESKQQAKPTGKWQQKGQPKGDKKGQKVQKRAENTAEGKRQNKADKKEAPKTQQAKKEAVKEEPPKVQPKEQEDDGWIVVSKKPKPGKK